MPWRCLLASGETPCIRRISNKKRALGLRGFSFPTPSPVFNGTLHPPNSTRTIDQPSSVMVLLHPPLPPLLPRNARPRPVAIVTGSSQGLGLAIALRLADDGCDIVVNDLPPKLRAMEDAVRCIMSKGARAVAVTADVSCEDEVKRLVEITVEKFGKLDIVRLSHRLGDRLTDWLVGRWWRTRAWWL